MTPDRTAWYRRAGELASWAMVRLVNRTDAYGAYTRPEVRGLERHDGKPGKVPASYTAKRPLTLWTLTRHFRGDYHHHVVGLHSTSTANTCRWGAFDVDRHGEGTDPAATHDMAMNLYREVGRRGFRPLLTDSNGKGGYHLRTLFRDPVPSRDLHHLLRTIAQAVGFKGEWFPKQPAIKHDGFGNWLRVPGLHHTRPHIAEAFDGERWLTGADAVDWLLSFAGDDAALVPVAPPEKPRAMRQDGPVWSDFRARENGTLDRRIRAYIGRCPNLGEGEGRDVVAFRLAAFLVRDLGLPDHVALPWLESWDAGNSPPKGYQRLLEIIESAHAYGKRGYGCGNPTEVRGG